MLRALGAGVVVVTLGDRGAYYDAPAGQGLVSALPVEVVDTTGAGDAFVAGFWSELALELRAGRAPAELERGRIEAAVRAGCQMASEAVSAMGATAGIVRRGERLLRAHGEPPRPWSIAASPGWPFIRMN